MTRSDRLSLMNLLSPANPDDLDALLSRFLPDASVQTQVVGQELAPCPGPGLLPPLPLASADAIAVGFEVTAPLSDLAGAAYRLAALAAEQDVEVIILTTLDYSGLERFGFRTERIAGSTAEEREACRRQIKQFWGIELTLPAMQSP